MPVLTRDKRVVLWLELAEGWSDDDVLLAVADVESAAPLADASASTAAAASDGGLRVELVHDIDEALEACAGAVTTLSIATQAAGLCATPRAS